MTIKKNYFVKNDEFLRLLEEFKETKVLTDELGKVFVTMAKNMLFSKQFINYSDDWKAEMESDALFNCCRYAGTFDTQKGSNPFAYFTRLIINAFIMRINKEKKKNSKEEELKTMAFDEFLTGNGLHDVSRSNIDYDNVGGGEEHD